jgi:hypothetical protein
MYQVSKYEYNENISEETLLSILITFLHTNFAAKPDVYNAVCAESRSVNLYRNAYILNVFHN